MLVTEVVNAQGVKVRIFEYTENEIAAFRVFNSFCEIMPEEQALATTKARFPKLTPSFWALAFDPD